MERRSRSGSQSSEASHYSTRRGNIAADGITPNVGFVIKTRRHDKTKIFINLYYHPFLKEMFPLPLTESWDKKGELCYVYGVIVPHATYTASGRDVKTRNTVRFFVCVIGMSIYNFIVCIGLCSQMCTDAIALLNTKYNDTLNLEFTTPKIVKGYVGAIVENYDVPQEYIYLKSKFYIVVYVSLNEYSKNLLCQLCSFIPYNAVERETDSAETVSGIQAALALSAEATEAAAVAATSAAVSTEIVGGEQTTPRVVSSDPVSTTDTTSITTSSESMNPLTKDVPVVDDYIIANPNLPAMIRTWARRKKRENKTLKTYYFVLERGTLSVFKDSREEPPYGHGLKASVFLANFRARTSMEAGEECVAVLEPAVNSNQSSSSSAAGSVSNTSESPRKSDGSASISKMDSERGNMFDGSKPILILFVDQKSLQKWLAAFRNHISWAVAHPEDAKADEQPKSRLSWIPFAKK